MGGCCIGLLHGGYSIRVFYTIGVLYKGTIEGLGFPKIRSLGPDLRTNLLVGMQVRPLFLESSGCRSAQQWYKQLKGCLGRRLRALDILGSVALGQALGKYLLLGYLEVWGWVPLGARTMWLKQNSGIEALEVSTLP